ncbi:MAG: uracil phosphoribosyltransferase [Campylobacterales bacterium]|nr:uracil phosphoribosyltransferase [Campylobacterales bacterium]
MIKEINHPLLTHYITAIRDNIINAREFRKNIAHIANLLFYEALRNEKLNTRAIETWQGKGEFPSFDESQFVFIPVLRAALPMMDALVEAMPHAVSGFLAMKRDEATLQAHIYYDRVPNIEGKIAIMLDPMVATGGSLIDAIELIKTKKPAKIISLNIIGAPVGLEAVQKAHSDIDIFIAQIDEKLNDDGFIIPGIGDAGDRAYNTL